MQCRPGFQRLALLYPATDCSLSLSLPPPQRLALSVAHKSAKNGGFQQNVLLSSGWDWTRLRAGGNPEAAETR